MLRVLVDDHGTSNDLLVRIDGGLSHVFVANTGWLTSFFTTDADDAYLWNDEKLIQSKRDDVSRLINFWLDRLADEEQTIYLPIDLSDQSGNALQLTRYRRVIRVNEVWTTDITDGTSKARFLANQSTIRWHTNAETYWELALQSIKVGLTWSLAKLQQPIVPLRYD